MDYPLTFALLLYFNVFYFVIFASVEFFLLIFKAYRLTAKYDSTVLLNEILALTFMVVIESIRLMLGQQHTKEDFASQLASVFRILVLTVPSMYAVTYFTFWQAFVIRLDLCLGVVMLIVQMCQVISSFFILAPKMGQMIAIAWRQRTKSNK